MALWHPQAMKVNFGGIGPFTSGGAKLVWHTVEGSTIEGAVAAYRASGSYPHFTVEWRDGKLRIAQHAAIDACVTTLKHPPGTPETNRAHCVQVEICGFAKDSQNWPEDMYRALAQLARWIETNAGVPRRCGVGFKLGAPRLSGAAFVQYAGHLGHQHVPGNDHWDPGAMAIEKVIAKSTLERHKYASRHLDVGEVGTDVRKLQRALNRHRAYRRKHHLDGGPSISTDGRYGGETERAVRRAAWNLGATERGVRNPGASKRLQRFIHEPNKRPRTWKRRQAERKGK